MLYSRGNHHTPPFIFFLVFQYSTFPEKETGFFQISLETTTAR
jgi:hypothetical protein